MDSCRQSDDMRSCGRNTRKNKNLATRSLQDRDVPIEKLVAYIKGDIDDDQASGGAKSLLDPLEYFSPKLVILPKHRDLALRIERLDVIGVDAPLGAKRWLPGHGPGKCSWGDKSFGRGGNEELGNLPLI